MRYIEVTVNTPGAEIDVRCQEMADMGAGGFVIENEEDFKAFPRAEPPVLGLCG